MMMMFCYLQVLYERFLLQERAAGPGGPGKLEGSTVAWSQVGGEHVGKDRRSLLLPSAAQCSYEALFQRRVKSSCHHVCCTYGYTPRDARKHG